MDQALREEEKKMRLLKFVVNVAQATLMQQADLTMREAFEIMKTTKQAVLNLFPGKEDAYNLIYAPQFRRIISERFIILGGLSKKR